MDPIAVDHTDERAARASFELVEAVGATSDHCGRASFKCLLPTTVQDAVRDLVPSKRMAARILDEGRLTDSDGHALRRHDVLAADEMLTLELATTRVSSPASEVPVKVLYEDPFLMAVDKPAGILVHGDGTDAETLTARVQGHLVRQGSAAVPQALHRLDVETSGIVLFSLAEEFQPLFDALVAGEGNARRLRKRYVALVEGRLPATHRSARQDGAWLVMEAPIARDRHDARRMRVGRTGKPAITRLRELGRQGGRTLVEAELVTGRRHQIRVHLAHLGLPIVGDALYGGARSERLMLHAHELRLVHPVTGEELALESPCPW